MIHPVTSKPFSLFTSKPLYLSTMFDYDKWQEIFNTISKNKLRTFLTALGVFWGIFMLVVLMGAGTGFQNGVYAMLGGHAKNSMYVWTTPTTMPYDGLQAGRFNWITNDDIEAIRYDLGDMMEYFSCRLGLPSGEVAYRDKRESFEVRGDTPNMLKIDAIELKNGRFINEKDMEERRKVVVIGTSVREQLFGKGDEAIDPIGEFVKIQGVDYMVVGETASDRKGENATEDNKSIFMPLTTAQQVTNRHNKIGWFVCTINPKYVVSVAEDRIKALIKKRHRIHPDDPRGVGTDNIEEETKEIMGLFTGINFLIWFVGIGSLLFGIIGVGNIMLIIVKDRTKEIGIRKAMGATPRSIISMILLESVFITTLAGYIGLVISIAVVYLMKLAAGAGVQFFTNPQIDLQVSIGALVMLIISGALTGLVPALQAANVNPVVALKDE
ncbi:MAG: ABC transporter permease [Bacteroidota bacterium]